MQYGIVSEASKRIIIKNNIYITNNNTSYINTWNYNKNNNIYNTNNFIKKPNNIYNTNNNIFYINI
jgi:hypothetical protein